MKRIKNILEYIIALIIIILLVITIISAIVIKFYGDDLENYAMDLINEKLNTAFEVDEIGVSIFRKFPNTSIYLKNIYIKSDDNFSETPSNFPSNDTLVHAKYIFLKVNVLDIIRNNMNVNSLELKNSKVNIFIDEKGNGNYTFNNDRVDNSNEFIFDFKAITLEDAKINYLNLAKQTESQFFIKKAELEGNFTKSSFRFSSGLSGNIGLFRIQDNTYIDNTSIKADLSVKVNQNLYDIQKGSFSLGDLEASVSGKILDSEDNAADLNLSFNGKNIDVSWLSEIINLEEKINEDLDVNGKFNIKGKIKGLASPTITPDISVFFTSQNAKLNTDLIPSPLESIAFRGSYSNGTLNSIESSSIIIDEIKASFDNSSIIGSLIVSNFLEPDFKTTLTGNILLSDFNWLLNTYEMNFTDGSLLPKLTVSGKIQSSGSDRKEVEINPMGELKIDNAALDIYKIPLEIHSINSNLRISNYNVKGTLKGVIGNTDIDSEIEVSNTQKYLKDNGQLIINGHLQSKHIDLDELIAGFRSERADKKSNKFVRNTLLNMGLEIDKLIFDSLNINKLRSDVLFQYPAFYANDFYMQIFGGDISGNMQIDNLNKDPYRLSLNANYKSINIKRLFKSMNNFGQAFIISDNIAGNINGNSEVVLPFGPNYKFTTSDLSAENNITITDGELIDFQPIIETYSFLNIEEPEHIRFSTLQNNLIISDNEITIPEMEIRSSAINLNASGVHSFNKTYNYHLALRLSELLYKKTNMAGNEEFKISGDPDDTRTVFLRLYNEGEGVKVEFDEEQAIIKVRNDLREEKLELQKVLKEEFSRKDISHDKEINDVDNSQPVFEFEFGVEDTVIEEKSKKDTRKKWWKK